MSFKLINLEIVLCIAILFFSCNDKQKIQVKQYNSGTIKSKKVIDNINDRGDSSYLLVKYFRNGTIREIYNIDSNHLISYHTYDSNSNLNTEAHLIKGTRTGIKRFFNSNKRLNREVVYIDGKKVLIKQFGLHKGFPNRYSYLYYKFTDNKTLRKEGGFVYNKKSNKLIDSLSGYYKVEATDTIIHGEDYYLNIDLKLNDEIIGGTLITGDLDTNLAVIDTTLKKKFYNKSFKIKINNYNSGYNLLLGEIYVKKKNERNNKPKFLTTNFTFYHEFYVKKPQRKTFIEKIKELI